MGRVIAYGDAIADGIARANPPTSNLARPGAGLAAGTLPPTHTVGRGDHVVIALGWSDVNAVFGPQPYLSEIHYAQRLHLRLSELETRNAGAAMVMLGLEPLARRYPSLTDEAVAKMNLMLEEAARRHRIGFFIPQTHPVQHRAKDGLHYTTAGYEVLMRAAGRLVNTMRIRQQMPAAPLTEAETAALLQPQSEPLKTPEVRH